MQPTATDEKFLALLKEHKKLIYKVCRSYCSDAAERKDLEQEIVIQLWKSFPRYNPEYKLSTWMYRIALNTAISLYRSSRARPEMSSLSEHILEMTASPHEGDDAEHESSIDTLHQFIYQLNSLNRALMILYLDGNSYKDMAEVLGLTETNVATKIHRLKQALKKYFSTSTTTPLWKQKN
jgi:RNA polymerase sigma-70 factor (ECF subfamily)